MAKVDISRSLAIQGWMGDEELRWLAEQASTRTRVAEIGCWLGRSTVALAQHVNGWVTAVDTWRGSPEHEEMLRGKPDDWLQEEFIRNITGLGNVYVFQMESVAAARFLRKTFNIKYDMVFLDAGHDRDSIRADIRAWRGMLVPGGLLCGHDYQPSWPDVVEAVNELLPGAEKIPGDRNTIWFKVME